MFLSGSSRLGQFLLSQALLQEVAVLMQGWQEPSAERIRSLLEQEEVAGPSVHLTCPQDAWQMRLAVTEPF